MADKLELTGHKTNRVTFTVIHLDSFLEVLKQIRTKSLFQTITVKPENALQAVTRKKAQMLNIQMVLLLQFSKTITENKHKYKPIFLFKKTYSDSLAGVNEFKQNSLFQDCSIVIEISDLIIK